MNKERKAMLDNLKRETSARGLGNESVYYQNGYLDGIKWAFGQIEKQIDLCSIKRYTFPILHIRDFIDKTLGRKE